MKKKKGKLDNNKRGGDVRTIFDRFRPAPAANQIIFLFSFLKVTKNSFRLTSNVIKLSKE
jgi:hypothetical protein